MVVYRALQHEVSRLRGSLESREHKASLAITCSDAHLEVLFTARSRIDDKGPSDLYLVLSLFILNLDGLHRPFLFPARLLTLRPSTST